MKSQRYIRQTVLPEFGPSAQEKLFQSSVLVVGAGGLGLPVLQYLTAMGFGTLGVVEFDSVEESNLHRQILFGDADINKSKLAVLKEKLPAQNAEVQFQFFEEKLAPSNALKLLQPFDVIVDCSDNFPTRYLINDACVILKKPFVYGAIQGFEGQVSVFNHQNGPTYRCLFPSMPDAGQIPDCNTNGVLGVVPGIIGNLQALETVKLLTGVGQVLSGVLLIFDALHQDYRKVHFSRKTEHTEINTLRESYQPKNAHSLEEVDLDEILLSGWSNNDLMVDVRTEEEFERFHLEKSVNIPLDRLEDALNKIDPDKSIYLLCQSGVRSLKACRIVKKNWPQARVIQVRGGLQNSAYASEYS